MSATLENRKAKVEEFLARICNSKSSIAELRNNELDPDRYLVAEFDSRELVWFWTVETLDEAEKDINNHEAGTPRDFTVLDLDSGKEHRVSMIAKVQR